MSGIHIPISPRGRKYGYVIWAKRQDREVKAFFGEQQTVTLTTPTGVQRSKRIDWQQRRISITQSLTRTIPESSKFFVLSKEERGQVALSFE